MGGWPAGLVGRVSLVLLIALLLDFTGSTVFFERAEISNAGNSRIERTAELLSADLRVLYSVPAAQRGPVAATLSTRTLRLAMRPAGAVPAQPHRLDALHDRLVRRIRPPVPVRLVLWKVAPDGTVTGTLQLPDDAALVFSADRLLGHPAFARGLVSASILFGCVLVVAVMLVRTLSRPLRLLAEAADAIGHGPRVPVEQSGPREVRGLAQAMSAMQLRIDRLISDRTESLAAVSHDLRTPLARLRLRTGFLEPDVQHAIEADLDEMEAMVASVLSYLAGEKDAEPARIVDLAVLLATLVDQAADAGRDARYSGPNHAPILLRPLATRRVFANLVSNALAYAGQVRITLHQRPDGHEVLVEDDGPGIPDAELGRVLTAFYRLDVSRSRATGGLGLGLAIVQREVLREGGRLVLSNRPAGGLRVSVTFPSGP